TTLTSSFTHFPYTTLFRSIFPKRLRQLRERSEWPVIAKALVNFHPILCDCLMGGLPGRRRRQWRLRPRRPCFQWIVTRCRARSEIGKHTSELQSRENLVCR